MNNIQKYTRLLQFLSIIFAVIMFSLTVAKWCTSFSSYFPIELYSLCGQDSGFNQVLSMPFAYRMLGLFIDLISIFIIFFGIIIFNRLMRKLQTGEFFTSSNVDLLNTLSKIALLWAVYNPIKGALLSVVTTLHKGVGKRVLSFGIGTEDIIHIFIFLCLVIITIVLKESLRLKKEQDLTI